MKSPEFGLIVHDETRNLGDDIQALAARRFLPRVDHLLDRESLNRDIGASRRVLTILNGWFMHRPGNWPPADYIDPLILSFHLAGSRRSRFFWPPRRTASEILLAPGTRDYLLRNGPVGARDRATLAALARAGVDAYLSGCLTLTLPRSTAKRTDAIVACDVPPKISAMLATRFGGRLRQVTHKLAATMPTDRRMDDAQALLDHYARARAVVTTRVHCVLPCLALGTPVLYIPLRSDIGRKGIATDLAHHCTAARFLRGDSGYDPDAPPSNPDRHTDMARTLAARCTAFIAQGLARGAHAPDQSCAPIGRAK